MRSGIFLLLLSATILFCSCDKDSSTTDSDNSSTPSAEASLPASEAFNTFRKMPAKPKAYFVETANSFLESWLKARGETKIVSEVEGVGVEGNPVRIQCLLDDYEKPEESTDDYSIETQFIVKLGDGREVIEFFKVSGQSFEEAVDKTLDNFTSSVLQVFYKGFINPDDTHLQGTKVKIGGVQRTMLPGEVLISSDESDPLRLFSLTNEMKKVLADVKLDETTHWIKIRHVDSGDTPISSVKVDNSVSEILTERVSALDWPSVNGVMICKQYLIIQ